MNRDKQIEENERLSGKVTMYEEERKYHFEMSRKRITEVKADTVREIFAEIEKVRMQHTFGNIDGSELNVKLYYLKKKYTEGEG